VNEVGAERLFSKECTVNESIIESRPEGKKQNRFIKQIFENSNYNRSFDEPL